LTAPDFVKPERHLPRQASPSWSASLSDSADDG